MPIKIICQVVVDYLQQQRKATRPSKKGVILRRDEKTQQIVLELPKSTPTIFNLEECVSKIYTNFVNDGKCTIELLLPGGTYANVLISNAKPEELKRLVDIVKSILVSPQDLYDMSLDDEKEQE
ncbi:hypothetical protein SAMD00019534_123560 [Acytostelium subglobosum LB1]|uniref:hypothetical protein n=1 Tax=Acytostelium subglobosum LB1 TaxID=1410327 RepID=UPI00064488F0|nr:hypothetical protein SAMD00019534_123560 [Acytostelium subglobosum LB1]GAM29180.1 hypothetical protein SAMD00019534_123560 [Acytostelium subglobosum LB1]|eukprot:XP_012747871.1 hypothetical protein SAMD00019534_123560 [Acytostelium subglobosum LB1]